MDAFVRSDLDMSEYIIPKNSGPFRIVTSMAGTPIVENGKRGKNKVSIPCRDREHAREVLQRLKDEQHNGVLRV